MSPARTPVVFIHGLWLHGSSWQPWVDLFAAKGYGPVAPGWPGEASTVADARRYPKAVAGYGIDDVTGRYACIIRSQADHTVPDVVTRAAYKHYGDSRAVTELKQFPDRGHSLTVDHGWRTVAVYALGWLGRRGVRPVANSLPETTN